MKVEFTKAVNSPKYGRINPGDKHDIPAADARAFIRDGRAEAVKSSRDKEEVTTDVS